MLNFSLRLALIVTFVGYMLSQTQMLKDDRDVIQYIVIGLMVVSMILIVKLHFKKLTALFSYERSAVSLGSIALFNLIFFEPILFWVVIFKVVFLMSCLVVLLMKDGIKIYISIVDCIVLTVLIISFLAQMGMIPTAISEMEGWTKNSVGFNNPNTPFYFLFSSFLIYFIFGSTSRILVCLLVMIGLLLVGSFSRTYVLGTALIFIFGLLIRYDLFRTLARPLLFTLFMFCWMAGSIFYITAAVDPKLLEPLALSPLDIALSYRLSLSLEDIYIPADNLVGFTFGSKDSIYNELIFIFGPIFWIMIFFGILRWWIASKYSQTAFKVFMVICIISVTGLTETIFLNVTPISSILLSIAFLSPNIILSVCNTYILNEHEKVLSL